LLDPFSTRGGEAGLVTSNINTLDGMLPALTATFEWQQCLTVDHFPT